MNKVVYRGCGSCAMEARTVLRRCGLSDVTDYDFVDITSHREEYLELVKAFPALDMQTRVALYYNPETRQFINLLGLPMDDKTKEAIVNLHKGIL